ncbi:hypothetical protein LPW36_08810 [Jinshanibacter sp. LJY008]|uniref:Secreted protein n=1 Tax=Limnobaculum eriocheiris TaxID=2897391 RepID=A0A9X1MWW3_9GAMM|nr:hypothetical protein [Limnobaculum eriocheiris]MCD1126098.1 hypothetical protein [Limnobaculum eriocheiris]
MKHNLVVKIPTIALLLLFCGSALAASKCGKYRLDAGNDGWTRVNNEKVTSQKISFLKGKDDWDNVKIDMGLMPARDGNMYGFEFIKRNGKAFLNVQLLQNSMDAPRIIGTFDCKKVK